jgi:sporulation-control protein spo0M
MAEVIMQWDVRGGEPAGSVLRFDPGAAVEGTVTVTPQADLNCSGIKLRLEWHTEGRGDRDGKVAEETILYQGVLPGGQPAVFPFHLTLPDQPWSYAGHYINILWELTADIDLPLAVNPKSKYPIVVRPREA